MVDAHNLSLVVGKYDVETQRGVGHPETPRFLAVKNKQHPSVVGQRIDIHQAVVALLFGFGHIDINRTQCIRSGRIQEVQGMGIVKLASIGGLV
mgnify:CR=1 FL=1